MKKLLFLFCLYGIVYAQEGSVLILTEIMFYPQEPNGEFVEIYNTSAIESIDLAGFKFKYYTSANNTLVPFSGDMILGPGKFAVIIQGNYDYASGVYKNIIPEGTLLLRTGSNNFGSSGMANTTSREIFLLNALDQAIDSYTYSADNAAGISDEKIELNRDNSAPNWKNSLRIHGSPGAKNSVSKLDYDLSISLRELNPLFPSKGDSLSIILSVKNKGAQNADHFAVELFRDANTDSIGQTSELLFYKEYYNLPSGDSIMITIKYFPSEQAANLFIAAAEYEPDEYIQNNRIVFSISPEEQPVSRGEIIVNEIMYAPVNDEPEWIEIFNNSDRVINLKGCKAGDNTAMIVVSAENYFLNPGDYLVICADSRLANYYSYPFKLLIKNLPSLSNSGDDVIIKNSLGITMDSVKYNPVWGGSGGRSLERLNATESSTLASNWKTAFTAARGTPGIKNSAFNPPGYSISSLIINEIMYEPDTGEAEFIELYNTTGDSIQIIGMETVIGNSGKLLLTDTPIKVPAGDYLVVASDSAIFNNFGWLTYNKLVFVNKNFGLSNEGTIIVVKDFYGTTLDSLFYLPGWHNKNFAVTRGRSLERINSSIGAVINSNWTSCVTVEGATPARRNSVFTENLIRELKISISPNPFSPDGDGFEDYAMINFNLPYAVSQIRVRVFDSQGRLVRTLEDNRPSASNNSIIFDGRNDEGKALRIGIYILLVEFISEADKRLESFKAPIVVARKL